MRKAYDTFVFGLAAMAGVAVTLIFLLIVVDVSVRTFNISPPSFTLAFVEYLLLYFAMFSAPYLVRKNGHVSIDLLKQLISGRTAAAIDKAVAFVCLCAALTFTAVSVDLFLEAIQEGYSDVRGVDIPMWAKYLPLFIGFFLIAVEFALKLIGSPPEASEQPTSSS